jgi:cytoskeleton protein RodZ
MNTLHAASPEDPKVLEFAESPGRRLRVHRQAKGLEVERIATQMHLRPAVVEALEQDRYDELPGPVFVIGYLRNYARLVGLDPQPLIEAYRATNPGMEAPAPRVSTAPAPRPEIGSSHVLVRLVSLALIAGVIALLVLWWQNRAEQMAPLALDGEEGALSMPGDMPEGLPGADPIEGVPEISGINEEAPAGAGPTGLTGLTEPPPADLGPTPAGGLTLPPLPEQPDAGAADSEDATAAAQPLEETADSGAAEASGETQTTADAPTEPEAPAETTPSPTEVVMEFSGPSWIQVKDASGAVVLTGSMVEGARRVVEGSPPFAFIIGNARNTRLSVGGAPFDLGARARGNVARFTLNPGETE